MEIQVSIYKIQNTQSSHFPWAGAIESGPKAAPPPKKQPIVKKRAFLVKNLERKKHILKKKEVHSLFEFLDSQAEFLMHKVILSIRSLFPDNMWEKCTEFDVFTILKKIKEKGMLYRAT